MAPGQSGIGTLRRASETETRGASFGIFFQQAESTVSTSVAFFTFDVRLKNKLRYISVLSCDLIYLARTRSVRIALAQAVFIAPRFQLIYTGRVAIAPSALRISVVAVNATFAIETGVSLLAGAGARYQIALCFPASRRRTIAQLSQNKLIFNERNCGKKMRREHVPCNLFEVRSPRC